jgi:solute carrier family 35 (UDP-galactose transporter), member B1
MAPVMMGSLVLGGASYSVRDYVQVLMIIIGTAIVSMGKHQSASQYHDSILGVMYILFSLMLDGVTAGYQKRFQRDMVAMNIHPKPYDFMYWTNLYMFYTALIIATLLGEMISGTLFLYHNPTIFYQIIQFTICSAIGQSFIFYTLANFDPLVLSTVTTTRKIFSVLLSILWKGNPLSYFGWTGICIACLGILSEMHSKMSHTSTKHTSFKK